MSEFERNLEKGGILFWLVTIAAAIGVYGLIWLVFALAVIVH